MIDDEMPTLTVGRLIELLSDLPRDLRVYLSVTTDEGTLDAGAGTVGWSHGGGERSPFGR